MSLENLGSEVVIRKYAHTWRAKVGSKGSMKGGDSTVRDLARSELYERKNTTGEATMAMKGADETHNRKKTTKIGFIEIDVGLLARSAKLKDLKFAAR
jgi:hypothetical protein